MQGRKASGTGRPRRCREGALLGKGWRAVSFGHRGWVGWEGGLVGWFYVREGRFFR